jgi:DNA polymerase III subunit epsilon
MFGLLKDKKAGLPVDEETAVTDVRYVVVDTELTGLNEKKDSIVSVGAVRMTGGSIGLGSAFSRLVSPGSGLSPASIMIHEITPSDVVLKPNIDTVLTEFMEFCGDAVLVGHFISIDLAFINRELKRMRGAPLANAAVDTYSLYEWLRKRPAAPGCPSPPNDSRKLYDLAKCFGIEVSGAHKALMDAFMTAQLFQRLLPLLARAGVGSAGELVRIGSPFKGGDRFKMSGEISNF